MRPSDKLSDSDPLFFRKDFWDLVWLNKIPGYSIVQKFGRNTAAINAGSA